MGSFLSGIVAQGLRSYAKLDREELVAVIQCERAYQKNADFTLIYTPIVHRNQGTTARALPIRGDEWAFGGTILRWKGGIRFLGAKTLYKPLWIEGRSNGRQNPDSIYSLQGDSFDPIWSFLHWAGESLPFVEASYGSSVSSRVEYGVRFYLYVTPTGFSVKKVRSYFRDIS